MDRVLRLVMSGAFHFAYWGMEPGRTYVSGGAGMTLEFVESSGFRHRIILGSRTVSARLFPFTANAAEFVGAEEFTQTLKSLKPRIEVEHAPPSTNAMQEKSVALAHSEVALGTPDENKALFEYSRLVPLNIGIANTDGIGRNDGSCAAYLAVLRVAVEQPWKRARKLVNGCAIAVYRKLEGMVLSAAFDGCQLNLADKLSSAEVVPGARVSMGMRMIRNFDKASSASTRFGI